MSTILNINASLFSEDGQSSKLAREFLRVWRRSNPGDVVIERDLAKNPVPHLTGERFQAFLTPEAERSPEQQAAVADSDALIDEIRGADVVVLGLPMYNFGIPSTLKAYFDHVARAGITFRYTDKGPVGLLENKQAYVLATRGGLYAGTAKDTQTEFVRNFLNFLGIRDVEFVYAEGLAGSGNGKLQAMARARDAIQQLAA